MPERDMNTPVGTLVANDPSLARVFEELRIDYCCHGSVSLAQACEQRQLDPEQVLRRINQSEGAPPDTRNWAAAPLTELCDHIEQTHHAFLRKELPRLEELTAKAPFDVVLSDMAPKTSGLRSADQVLSNVCFCQGRLNLTCSSIGRSGRPTVSKCR